MTVVRAPGELIEQTSLVRDAAQADAIGVAIGFNSSRRSLRQLASHKGDEVGFRPRAQIAGPDRKRSRGSPRSNKEDSDPAGPAGDGGDRDTGILGSRYQSGSSRGSDLGLLEPGAVTRSRSKLRVEAATGVAASA